MRRCPVLVERDDELQALAGLLAAPSGRIALITGEAGTGKSRLAQEFAASVAAPWSTHSVRLSHAAGMPALPDARPLVLVLDDAHHLEPAALAALPDVLEDGVVVVATFRLGLHPAGSAEMRALAALARDQRASELRLLPLSPEGIDRMAAAMGRYAGGNLHARTGGNPFWTEEILRTGMPLPWTVVETVTVQLDTLPRAARELAGVLALADDPLPARAAARLVDDLDAAWSPLAASGLAYEDAGALVLAHALVGEAIASRLAPGERAGAHERLAAALEGEPVPLDQLARHWAQAGATDRAAALARAAVDDLRTQGASRRAFACFEIALRSLPPVPEDAAALYEEAALTAARIGEYDAMHEWVASAERLYREAGRPDRAARMVLDPAFDYLPVRRSAAIRDEPVERMLANAQAAMATRSEWTSAWPRIAWSTSVSMPATVRARRALR